MTPSEITFRRSTARVLTYAVVVALAALIFAGFMGLVFDESWRDPFALVVVAIVGAAVYLPIRREPGLPMRLTADSLTLTGADGETLETPWDNVKTARVRRWLSPALLCELADGDRAHPPLERWGWAEAAKGTRAAGIERPYGIRVSLVGVTPGVRQLRAEIQRRAASG
ncbi:hypothetical protein O7635_23810 [Asanoa sp. WMMD1127]|uniref:hypothetical protein n=1 Tax=Asanoa sp. WMMD1127 TaxID=3016107 RepID=UPI002417510E|nr:hypothetical protein [Asanoa sp. WMMD1127]MDG4824887.1 hypothetical protein [Asanoa sp. WMMD1127]